MDILIKKNISISNIDSVLWNRIEKLYRVNKDFVRLSDKLENDIGCDDLWGCPSSPQRSGYQYPNEIVYFCWKSRKNRQ